MASSDLTKVFLLSCDKRIETDVQSLITSIQSNSGKISLKTINNVPEAKGADFAKKLENLLMWPKAVLIICSDNLVAFFDKKDSSNCPDIIKNQKNSLKVLKNFVEKQMKTIPNKLVLVSINGNTNLPKVLKAMPVINKAENEAVFIRRVIAELEGK